jgi:hypothetical protein
MPLGSRQGRYFYPYLIHTETVLGRRREETAHHHILLSGEAMSGIQVS